MYTCKYRQTNYRDFSDDASISEVDCRRACTTPSSEISRVLLAYLGRLSRRCTCDNHAFPTPHHINSIVLPLPPLTLPFPVSCCHSITLTIDQLARSRDSSIASTASTLQSTSSLHSDDIVATRPSPLAHRALTPKPSLPPP